MESKTNWRKVWATQPTIVIALPDFSAEGNEIRAMPAKAYAHHIVATPEVIFAANLVLKVEILLMWS